MLRRVPVRTYASRRHGLLDALAKPAAKAPAKAAPKAPKEIKKEDPTAAAPAAEKPAPAPRVAKPFNARSLKIDLDKCDLRWMKAGPVTFAPSGFVKPLGHTEEIPFQFTRTPAGQLPIYRDYRNQRQRILTEVRKYTGDVKSLENEIRKIVREAKLERRFGHLVVHGDWANEIKSWLYRLGF